MLHFCQNCRDNQLLEVLHCGVAHKTKYPESVRQFCLSLHYHSPRGYEYVRRTFNYHLPSSKTIQRWYAASDIRGEPGIQQDTFSRLKIIADKYEEQNKSRIVCCLMLDEMSIRSQVFWSQQRLDYVGLAGTASDTTMRPIAKHAFVFMLNGRNVDFEFPVAYYLISSMDKSARGQLLSDVIKAVTESGVKIVACTFDGHPCNFGMAESLGANLDVHSNEFQPIIKNPLNGEKIYILLDVPHMEKLVRNALGTRKVMFNSRNEKIEWCYIEKFYEYTKEGNLRTHKLTKQHMNWKRNPMNVRLAVQTFSASNAKVLRLLQDQSHADFINCGPTIEFIEMMNNLFDICNTRYRGGSSIFKQPFSNQNKRIIYDYFEQCIEYFKNLKIMQNGKKVPVLKSQRKTAFRGYIIDMHSIRLLFEELVEKSQLMTCLPTYHLSQDVLEMFFGKIRSCCGFNNNPNADQFKGAYRKIQCNNCRLLDKHLPDSHFSIFISSRLVGQP